MPAGARQDSKADRAARGDAGAVTPPTDPGTRDVTGHLDREHLSPMDHDGARLVGTTSASGTALVGRERELAALGELLSDVGVGRSRALVLSGAPGIGKTALLEEALESISSVQVIRISGVESEAEITYGALHGVWSHLSADPSALPFCPKSAR